MQPLLNLFEGLAREVVHRTQSQNGKKYITVFEAIQNFLRQTFPHISNGLCSNTILHPRWQPSS
jgi:hypothetical protein